MAQEMIDDDFKCKYCGSDHQGMITSGGTICGSCEEMNAFTYRDTKDDPKAFKCKCGSDIYEELYEEETGTQWKNCVNDCDKEKIEAWIKRTQGKK